MLSNHEIAQTFFNLADTLEILGENKFKFLAYKKAGEVIAGLSTSVADLAERGRLEELPGIGPAISAKIEQLVKTGKLDLYERLKEKVPTGVLELLQVPGVGAKAAGRLYHELGIGNLEQLREALESGKLNTIKGFGQKTQERILQGLGALERWDDRMLLATALPLAREMAQALREAYPALVAVEPTGSLRRARPTVGDIDLLAAAADPGAAIQAFVGLPQVSRVESQGPHKTTVLLHNNTQIDLLVVEPERWGSGLHHFTGSKEHSIQIRALAQAQGLTFSEYGFRREDGSEILCATEEEVFAVVGLPWIPPELREGQGEIEAAREGRLPRLVELRDLKADLHTHTTWSDGKRSIAEMAEAAQALGYSYYVISDHSAYLGVTGGLDAERLKQQRAEIDALNEEYTRRGLDFRLLQGCEVDITPDGTLALPDEVLAELDLVVASLHVALRQERGQITDRLLNAIYNPHVDIIGHPTGRRINQREGADLDLVRILEAAAETDVILEVNSGPDRLDLDASNVREALRMGIKLSIDSDAHHPDNLRWIELGVLTARRGWASADQVVNTWPLERLRAHLAARGEKK